MLKITNYDDLNIRQKPKILNLFKEGKIFNYRKIHFIHEPYKNQ